MDFFSGNDDYPITAEFMQVRDPSQQKRYKFTECLLTFTSDWREVFNESHGDAGIRMQVSSKIELLDRLMSKLIHCKSCKGISVQRSNCAVE